MTDQDIIKAIAELDGKWSTQFPYVGYHEFEQAIYLPAYLTSRDAIVPIREKLVNTQVLRGKWMEIAVMVILETEKEVDEYAMTHLTAAQECKTLLLLFNQWS